MSEQVELRWSNQELDEIIRGWKSVATYQSQGFKVVSRGETDTETWVKLERSTQFEPPPPKTDASAERIPIIWEQREKK